MAVRVAPYQTESTVARDLDAMIGQVLESIGKRLAGIGKLRAERATAELQSRVHITHHVRERRPFSQNRGSRMGLDNLLMQRCDLRGELEYAEHAGEPDGTGNQILEQH